MRQRDIKSQRSERDKIIERHTDSETERERQHEVMSERESDSLSAIEMER